MTGTGLEELAAELEVVADKLRSEAIDPDDAVDLGTGRDVQARKKPGSIVGYFKSSAHFWFYWNIGRVDAIIF